MGRRRVVSISYHQFAAEKIAESKHQAQPLELPPVRCQYQFMDVIKSVFQTLFFLFPNCPPWSTPSKRTTTATETSHSIRNNLICRMHMKMPATTQIRRKSELEHHKLEPAWCAHRLGGWWSAQMYILFCLRPCHHHWFFFFVHVCSSGSNKTTQLFAQTQLSPNVVHIICLKQLQF